MVPMAVGYQDAVRDYQCPGSLQSKVWPNVDHQGSVIMLNQYGRPGPLVFWVGRIAEAPDASSQGDAIGGTASQNSDFRQLFCPWRI